MDTSQTRHAEWVITCVISPLNCGRSTVRGNPDILNLSSTRQGPSCRNAAVFAVFALCGVVCSYRPVACLSWATKPPDLASSILSRPRNHPCWIHSTGSSGRHQARRICQRGLPCPRRIRTPLYFPLRTLDTVGVAVTVIRGPAVPTPPSPIRRLSRMCPSNSH